eukprot:30044-Prymnesium_polylepis.1
MKGQLQGFQSPPCMQLVQSGLDQRAGLAVMRASHSSVVWPHKKVDTAPSTPAASRGSMTQRRSEWTASVWNAGGLRREVEAKSAREEQCNIGGGAVDAQEVSARGGAGRRAICCRAGAAS